MQIDARGLTCPQPVIKVKKALEENKNINVLVDNEAAVKNISRLAKNRGCFVEAEKKEDGSYNINIVNKVMTLPVKEKLQDKNNEPKIVIYINSNLLGHGDEELGKILMYHFLNTLMDVAPQPEKIICINKGVFLTTEVSEVLESLKQLEERGVQILSCGTCLDYYKLKNKVQAGIVSNMYDILSSLLKADRVIIP